MVENQSDEIIPPPLALAFVELRVESTPFLKYEFLA